MIEAPSLPVRPDSRQAARNAMVAGLVTLLLTMLVAVVRDVAAAARGGDRGDFQDLSALWAETKHDVFHPIRALRRRPRGA